jgi:gamma-glutamylcyclotransferase (GGCT)/AIG2-like uncharacterized protein YtfP
MRLHQVFVYGTLRRGERNHGLLAGSRRVREQAWVTGTLHETGFDYPALVLSGAGRVYGEIYAVSGETLASLDELEQYEARSDRNLFERVKVTAQTDQGEQTVELYVQPEPNGVPIAGGDWAVHQRLTAPGELLYFAYGSCMDTARFQTDGVVDQFARVLGRGRLEGYSLQFRRRSAKDGRGRADLVEDGGRVEGKVYRIGPGVLPYLYRREGVESGAYRPCFVGVAVNGRPAEALTFLVIDKEPEEVPPPAHYVAEILRGARGIVSTAYYRHLERRCRGSWSEAE